MPGGIVSDRSSIQVTRSIIRMSCRLSLRVSKASSLLANVVTQGFPVAGLSQSAWYLQLLASSRKAWPWLLLSARMRAWL